jgi:hypothetical protein
LSIESRLLRLRPAARLLGRIRRRRLTIVTGADETHGASLAQFVRSALEHERRSRLVVWDLGLRADQLAQIRRIAPGLEIRTFDYAAYPPWFDIRVNAGEYAWKPVIVAQMVEECSGPVLWLDAGCKITGPLDEFYVHIVRNGFNSPNSAGTHRDWTHPKTVQYFGLPPRWRRGKRNVNGAAVGFDPRHPRGAELAAEWGRLARVRRAIAPPGSSRANHRQDQALLAVLAYRHDLMADRTPRPVNFLVHQDVPEPPRPSDREPSAR